jgi:hypothetical protein
MQSILLNEISWTICLGWPWVVILLISASQVARITGVSHQHLSVHVFLMKLFLWIVEWNVL